MRGDREEFIATFQEEEKVYEVSQYLDNLNDKLGENEARIKGEVSSFEHRGNYIFFGIKDKNDESLLNCFMWNDDYAVSGLTVEEGMEIIIWGYPNIFKPSGRLSFQTKLVELVGEGLLKKAYEELKRKLEKEGIFALERKKPLPRFVKNIGLITSHQGAAIGDFISNVGNYGYKIKFYDSRVEGKQAMFDLVKGIKWFNKNYPDLDILVIVRGGGSLESLQAFNTEIIVREIAGSKIPVIAGIGHEKDVSLVALAADRMVSTPTAAALEIRRPWDEAIHQIERSEKEMLNSFSMIITGFQYKLSNFEQNLLEGFFRIYAYFEKLRTSVYGEAEKIKFNIGRIKEELKTAANKITSSFGAEIRIIKERIGNISDKISHNSPERQLKLGYSIARIEEKIIRSVKNIGLGDNIDIQLNDGNLKAEVKNIYD